LLPVKRESSHTVKRTSGVELVGGHVIAVRPDAKLRVVRELGSGQHEIVEIVGSGRVARSRDRYRLVVRRSRLTREGKLADQPAVRHSVVEDYRIASIDQRRKPAKRSKQTALPEGRSSRVAVLVVDPH